VAAGRLVLDVGCGPGALTAELVARLGPGAVAAVDPSEQFVAAVCERLPGVAVRQAAAEDLPFGDDSFDVAVSTLVLCGVDDQPRALRELRRVLRPGGRLLFIEHVRSTDPELARFQDRMNGINRFIVGCDCNRPTLDSLQEAGFTIAQVEYTTLPKAPKFARPAIVGSATAPASVPSRDAQLATGDRP